MMRARLLALIFVLLAGALLLFEAQPSSAQSGCALNGFAWCTELDFRVAPYGTPVVYYGHERAQWTQGIGWETVHYTAVGVPTGGDTSTRRIAQFSVDLSQFASNGMAQVEIFYKDVTKGIITCGPNSAQLQNSNISGTGSLVRANTGTSYLVTLIVGFYCSQVNAPDPGGTGIIERMIVRGNGAPPVTPTPTPTPTPTELPAIAVTRHTCAFLGERALFTQGWTFSGGAAARTGGGADMPTGGLAQTMLQLQRAVKYALDVRFRATLPQETHFEVTVGATTLPVYVENTAARQTFTLPPVNYRPDSDGLYPLRVTGPNEGAPLIVDYICLRPVTDSAASGFEPISCAACEFISTGDLLVDFIRVIEWLFCALRRLIECQLTVLLWQVYRFTADTVMILLALGRWFAESAQGAVTWMNGNATAVAYYLAGSLDNTISVGVITVESGAGFWDAVISIFENVFGFLTTGIDRIAATITTLIEALRDVILEFLGIVSDALGVLVALVGAVVALIQSAAAFILTAAPQLFQGFAAAFNGEIEVADMTAFEQIAAAISCQGYTVPGSNALTNAFCETNYIFANTIFAGINRVWLFVLAGALGINVLIHALRMLRRAFG